MNGARLPATSTVVGPMTVAGAASRSRRMAASRASCSWGSLTADRRSCWATA